MSDGLWGMTAGALLLLGGLYHLRLRPSPRRRRRTKLFLLCGGCLFVLGMLFVCCPRPESTPLLWGWGGLMPYCSALTSGCRRINLCFACVAGFASVYGWT